MPGDTWNDVANAVASVPAHVQHGVAIQRGGDGASWQSNGNRRFPAASTIKLAILVATARAIDAGDVAPDDIVPVAPASRVPGSGVLTWLRQDLPLTIADLAYLMIAISDNTASNALIDAAGDDRIAETISTLGLTGTGLNRRFIGRLPTRGEPENWTTAVDLVTLLARIADDTAASPERCRWMRDLLALQQHRDRLGRELPESVTFGGKSGSLPGIVHDAGLLTGAGGTIAVAVLLEGVADAYAADALLGQIGRAAAHLAD
ncbi:MAG: serine hydrolase [Thermomicrobiales bacterium]